MHWVKLVFFVLFALLPSGLEAGVHTTPYKGIGFEFEIDSSELSTETLDSSIEVHMGNITEAILTPGVVYQDVENRTQDPTAYRFKQWMAAIKKKEVKGGDQHGSRRLNVFLPDERVPIQNATVLDEYPYRTVGLLGELQGRSFFGFCTGTIVSEWLVLTAGHCVQSTPLQDLRILTGFVGGLGNYIVGFTSLVYEFNSQTDYALALMEEPLGRYTGYPGIYFHSYSFFDKTRPLSLISYSGDLLLTLRAPSAIYNCESTLSIQPFGVLHDCDATRGSSGSAVFSSDWYNCSDRVCYGEGCYCRTTTTLPYILGVNSYEFRNGEEASLVVANYSHGVANGFHPAINFQEVFVNMSRKSNEVFNCSAATNCSSCGEVGPACGWCKERQECMVGDTITPVDIQNRCEEWYSPLDHQSCEIIDATPLLSSCESSTSCSHCTSREDRQDCGWCATEERCLPGTVFGPETSSNSCPQWDWQTPQCSCFNCPEHSAPLVRCPKGFRDCACKPSFRKVLSSGQCVKCNSFVCPENASPSQKSRKKNCVASLDDCRCNTGHEMSDVDSKCLPCNAYQCPSYSIPKPELHRCAKSFKDCKCTLGYKPLQAEQTCQDCFKLKGEGFPVMPTSGRPVQPFLTACSKSTPCNLLRCRRRCATRTTCTGFRHSSVTGVCKLYRKKKARFRAQTSAAYFNYYVRYC